MNKWMIWGYHYFWKHTCVSEKEELLSIVTPADTAAAIYHDPRGEVRFFQISDRNFQWRNLEGHPRYRKLLITPIYKPFRPFGRGPTTPGDLRSPWSWDDPSSRPDRPVLWKVYRAWVMNRSLSWNLYATRLEQKLENPLARASRSSSDWRTDMYFLLICRNLQNVRAVAECACFIFFKLKL